MRQPGFLWIATVILLVAAVLRIVNLATLPPGPHFDEAANLIIARTVAFGGAHYFPMVENYQGREVLYYYLSAPVLALVHDSRFGLQLVSVYSNMLLVATTMALGRLFFPGRRGLVVGLAAGVVAAVSLPQVLLARQAFRAITLPTMQGLALVFLWHGLRAKSRRSWAWLVIGGLLAGSAVYTYNSSRLFPIWLALAGLSLIIFDRQHWGFRLRQGLAFFIPLTLVTLPFAVYAFHKPDVFLGRLYEVTGGADEVSLLHSIGLHARMFFIHGEALLRYNPPGRPYFTLLEGALLLVGIGTAGFYTLISTTRPALERAACMLLLLSPLMIVPSVIATSGLPPNHMRSIAMAPLVFVLVALGFSTLMRNMNNNITTYGATVILLIIGAAHTLQTYHQWGSRADLYYNTDADLAAAAQWVQQGANVNDTVYVAAQDHNHPTVTVFDTPTVRWLGTDTLFLPPSGERTVIYPRSAPPPADWQDWLTTTQIHSLPLAPDDRTAFDAMRLSSDAPLPPKLTPVGSDAVQNDFLSLVAAFDDKALPAGRVSVTTAWRVLQSPTANDLTPIVHLEDSLGNVIARAESFSVGTNTWEAGETLIQRVPNLKIPIGTPPGTYQLRMTWVIRSTDQYLPFTTDNSEFAGVWASIGQIEVLRPNAFPPPSDLDIATEVYTETDSGITFLGYNNYPSSFRPGEVLYFLLYWQATSQGQSGAMSYSLSLKTADTDTPLAVHSPTFDQHPTDTWINGQLMMDRIQVMVPSDIPAASYDLVLETNDNTVISLGDVDVVGVPRVFEAPPTQEIVDQTFGNTITLHGYNIHTTDTDFELSLVWQAAHSTTADYTVFVHLLNASDEIIAQRDVMPQNNAYPTSLWAAGEFVTDSHTFTRTEDLHRIRIGLYLPQDGTRLPLANGETALFIFE